MTDSRILRQRIIGESLGQLISPSNRSAVSYSARFITSPKFVLNEPFNYNRENPQDYVVFPPDSSLPNSYTCTESC